MDQPDYHHSTPVEAVKKRTNKSPYHRPRSNGNLKSPTDAIYDIPKYTRVYTDINTQTRLNSSYGSKDLNTELQNTNGNQVKRRVKRSTASKIRPISNIETCNDAMKDHMYRCISEESLLGPYGDYTEPIGNDGGNNKRPVTHRKGRAPSPPPANEESCQPKPPARTSRSRRRGKPEFKRSQSTPRLDGTATDSLCSNNIHEEPPSYHEALCRRTILKRLHTPPKVREVTDQQRLKQTIASKHARQLYEDSLKRYSQNKTPVLQNGDQEQQQYYNMPSSPAKSAAIKQHINLHRSTSEGMHLKLQHLPPVHLKSDSALVARSKRMSSSQQQQQQKVGCQAAVNVKYQVHEYSMYDDRNDIRCSVAKLRQLFGEKSSGSHQVSPQPPPPYRPPPAAKAYVNNGNNRDCTNFLNKPVIMLQDLSGTLDDNFGEESYV